MDKSVKPNFPYYLYKIAHYCYVRKIPVLPSLIKLFLRVIFNAVIPCETKIGKNVHFGFNGMGVILHRKCVIGDNVHIYHQVTLGGGRADNGVPRIGNNVIIGAGAKVLGGVTVGDNSKIGANAVVINDVPPGSTVVGVPAKVCRKK